MPSKLSKQDVEEFIKKNNLSNKFELIEFSGKASTKSKFKDKIRNVEFECEFAIFKRNLKRNPETTFSISKEEQKQKSKETFQKKYGADHFSKTSEFKEKSRETSLKKFGVTNIMKSQDGLNKQRKSLMKSYGVSSPLKSKEIKEKQQKSTLKSTGFEHSFQNPDILKKAIEKNKTPEVKNKRIKTNNLLYGGNAPIKNKEVREKIENTNFEKYGNKYFFNTCEFKNIAKLKLEDTNRKILNKKIENGFIKFHNGKSLKDLAQEANLSYSHFVNLKNLHGIEEASKHSCKKSSIEVPVEEFLKNQKISFRQSKILPGTNYRPDFLIEDYKLIIECDGLFWHSEANQKNDKYHVLKKKAYSENGYSSLFFREDEIIKKFEIVKSIIKNKLNLNKKIGARKCKIEIGKNYSSFLNDNHLMGNGSGRFYSLSSDNEVVAVMQVKWKNRQKKQLEISRFCTKNGISVVGGFSKLIKFIIKNEDPNIIITFIDKRYGSGKYLEKMNWIMRGEYTSFKWTNFKESYHRMQFPANTGEESGMFKIWDCGQARWELDLKK